MTTAPRCLPAPSGVPVNVTCYNVGETIEGLTYIRNVTLVALYNTTDVTQVNPAPPPTTPRPALLLLPPQPLEPCAAQWPACGLLARPCQPAAAITESRHAHHQTAAYINRVNCPADQHPLTQLPFAHSRTP